MKKIIILLIVLHVIISVESFVVSAEITETTEEEVQEEKKKELTAEEQYQQDLINYPWLNEKYREEQYFVGGNTWPPKFIPNTIGWKQLYSQRFDQIMHLDGSDEANNKYDGWLVNTLSGIILPNITNTGWGLTRAPNELTNALKQGIHDGINNNKTTLEYQTGVIQGPRALMIHRPDLLERVLYELQPIVEAWSGQRVIPHKAYGFRLYQNTSRLRMHIDRTSTHVISFILHIDSSNDAKPWPIVIEDFHGNTNEVLLTSGDILLYESAKCIHGRPTTFNGSWYSSVFVHYYPVDENFWNGNQLVDDAHYTIPPLWNKNAQFTNQHLPSKLEVISSSFNEPDCQHGWCNLQNTVKWNGPGEEGIVLTTGGSKYPLQYLNYNEEEEKEEQQQQPQGQQEQHQQEQKQQQQEKQQQQQQEQNFHIG